MAQINMSQRGRVRIIEIDNPQKRNAVTHVMARDLLRKLKDADADPATRAVVVTGKGGLAFSSGHDLNEASMFDEEGDGDLAFDHPERMKTPVIAAISGHCHAAGLMLALSCDIRIADPSARFRQPGAAFGMIPLGGQVAKLSRMLPPGRAKIFLLATPLIDGETATRWGMVDELVEGGGYLDRALQVAEAIAANSPRSIACLKEGIDSLPFMDAQAQVSWEQETSDFLLTLPDAKEGAAAAREKRKPEFPDL
ncbi:enoyl-CoA hydratase/isomerase family protein [Mameliella alba]|nr:enoyl-CoA hydratase/isomerase family protein [Mameliella alba]MBY6170274.1 enoyl-CoA hydratase/isomerase family protein [Mameliella alba]MBY6175293.1 enoyl-CoA hydratase/isomerase family protein [Mameliella alba]